MSSIPPAWLSSIIQGQGAQQRAGEARQRESDSESVAKDGPFAHQLDAAISSDDRDAQVYSDAEGAGGQGRDLETSPEEAQQQDENGDADDAPPGHIDVSA